MAKARILSVIHDNGEGAYCLTHPNALLFEVAEGAHQGKRGCDGCLFDLVGPIQWNQSEVVSYETGDKRPAS